MNDSKKEPSGAAGVGCYVVLMYLLYWPALYAMRAGAEWHASTHPSFSYDWGEPGFWALAWIAAPITTPFLLLGAVTYWVISPVLGFIVRVFW